MASSRLPKPLGFSAPQSSPAPDGRRDDEPFATRRSKGYKPGPLGVDGPGPAGGSEESESYLRSIREFDLREIPKIMRRKGWPVAAALMERWFDGDANADPYKGKPCTGIVKMEWVLGFKRAQNVYDRMFEERVWVNAKARAVIIGWLKKHHKFTKTPATFGDFTRPVPKMEEEDYVQYRSVVQPRVKKLDEMTAALGNFNFRVVVKGNIMPLGGGKKYGIFINAVGVFVCDPYDFNDDQELGYWNDQNDKVQIGPHRGSMKVTNASFRQWRGEHPGKGGDFLVFSDLKVTALPTPDYFEVDEADI